MTQIYTGPITVGQTTNIKASGWKAGLGASAIVAFLFVVRHPTPIATPPGGTYVGEADVVLSCADGGVVHFTTDGSTPDSNSAPYVNPIQMTVDTTIKAIAVTNGGTGAILTANYVIQ